MVVVVAHFDSVEIDMAACRRCTEALRHRDGDQFVKLFDGSFLNLAQRETVSVDGADPPILCLPIVRFRLP